MELNTEALAAALKMSGQDTAQLDKTIKMVKMVNVIRENGATPETMMTFLAQFNPKYAAMAALVRALGTAEQKQEPTAAADYEQYNHF